MSNRRLAIAAIALVVIGGTVAAWLLMRATAPTIDSAAVTAGRESKPVAPPPLAPASSPLAAQPAKSAPAPSARPEAPAPPDADAAPLTFGEGPVRLVLHLVGDGVRPTRIDVYAQPDGDHERHVELRLDGEKPEGRLPKAEKYDLSATLVLSEGHEAYGATWHDLSVPADGVFELDVRLPVRPVIEVVDSMRSTPIPTPRAVSDDWIDDRSERAAPGASRDPQGRTIVMGDEAGRIRLPLVNHASHWWIGGPGHAWTRAHVAVEAGVTRVALGPGGGLRVDVEGFSELDEPRVVATQPPAPTGDAQPLAPLGPAGQRDPAEAMHDIDMVPGDAPGEFVLDGLPPGSWKVIVGHKGSWTLSEVWGEATVEVFAGKFADVRLKATKASKLARFDVELELDVPDGWRGQNLRVTFDGVGEKTDGVDREVEIPADLPPGPHRSVVKGLTAGPYEFLVYPMEWCSLVRVKGNETLHVAIPPPARVAVRVLDEQGKPTIRAAEVQVHYGSPFDRDETADPPHDPPSLLPNGDDAVHHWGGGSEDIPFDGARGVFAGPVASGRITIEAKAPGRMPARVPLTLAPGAAEREVEIRLSAGAAIEMRVVRDGKVVQDAEGDFGLAPHRDRPASEDEDGGGWSKSRSVMNGRGRFDGLESGTFDVSWERGRKKSPVSKTVVVRVGETVTVDFEDK